jgi:hypothetical protein
MKIIKSSNIQIVKLLMILGLGAFLGISCLPGNTPANGNSTNKNTTVSSNANSSTPMNANTTATAANSDSSKTEQKANTNVANKTDDSAETEKGDCTLKEDNAEFFISATEKTVKLKKATPIKYVMFGNQGLAVVEAKIDGKWVKGEIQDVLLDCPDDGKDEPVKK